MTMKRTPRPRDPIQLGKLMVHIATGAVPDAVDIPTRGQAGGLKGGVARRDRLSETERREIARRAAEARWKAAKGEPE